MISGNLNNYHYSNRESSRINTYNDMKQSYKPYETLNNIQKPTKNLITNLPVQQERVINFGQDINENTFKKILRQPILKNSSFNIINNNVYNNNFSNTPSYSQFKMETKNVNKKENIENLFLNYNNPNNFYSNKQNLKLINDKDEKNNKYNSIFNNYLTPLNQSFDTKKLDDKNNLKDKLKESDSNYYIQDSLSVVEYSYYQEQNPRFRSEMEDFTKCIDNFNNDKEKGYFSLFDGHGGSDVVKYVKERMPDILLKLINSNNDSFENILTTCFNRMDEELKVHVPLAAYMGCTATLIYINKEKDNTGYNLKKVIYCANVGDSRAVIVTSSGAKRITYDHKASDWNEMNRIRSSGGIIFNDRVYGQLVLTRALGDLSLKKQGVIPNPYITKYIVSEKDKYIVICSDGVWDVISDDDIFTFSKSIKNSFEFAKLIVNNSLIRGSRDNISCLVLRIN